MDTLTIEGEIKKFITGNILSGDVVVDRDTLLQDAGMDSYSMVEIILFIERQYHVSIPNDRLAPENFESIGAIARTIKEVM